MAGLDHTNVRTRQCGGQRRKTMGSMQLVSLLLQGVTAAFIKETKEVLLRNFKLTLCVKTCLLFKATINKRTGRQCMAFLKGDEECNSAFHSRPRWSPNGYLPWSLFVSSQTLKLLFRSSAQRYGIQKTSKRWYFSKRSQKVKAYPPCVM